jgi:hypothetical protein
MAFQLKEYIELIKELKQSGYHFAPVKEYFMDRHRLPIIFLRHDIDRFPHRALRMAKVENDLGVSSTYYFRYPFSPRIIDMIAWLGHEIGFHYENGNFRKGLEELRKIYPVKTATAHFKSIGKEIDLGSYAFDPMKEIDFTRCLYVTDTGGIFGSADNLRDWAPINNLRTPTSPWVLGGWLSSFIKYPIKNRDMVLLSCHPERWPESKLGFIQAELMDRMVNCAKPYISMGSKTVRNS